VFTSFFDIELYSISATFAFSWLLPVQDKIILLGLQKNQKIIGLRFLVTGMEVEHSCHVLFANSPADLGFSKSPKYCTCGRKI
jgi:hypothetical protein